MTRFNSRRGDAACNNLNCGTKVRSKLDLRHTGEVLSIHWGRAKVRWDDYGWISEEYVNDLERAYSDQEVTITIVS
jgi:hypothetical protein